jgi:hypothetical protein
MVLIIRSYQNSLENFDKLLGWQVTMMQRRALASLGQWYSGTTSRSNHIKRGGGDEKAQGKDG